MEDRRTVTVTTPGRLARLAARPIRDVRLPSLAATDTETLPGDDVRTGKTSSPLRAAFLRAIEEGGEIASVVRTPGAAFSLPSGDDVRVSVTSELVPPP